MTPTTLLCAKLGINFYPDWGGNEWSGYQTDFGSYAGRDAGGGYKTTIIKFKVPDFYGTPDKIVVVLPLKQYGNTSATLRWQLAISDSNKNSYLNTAAAVTDPNQFINGSVTIYGLSDTPMIQYLVINNTSGYPFIRGATYYLFLWAGSTTSGSNVMILQTDNLLVDLYYSGNFVRLYAGGAWGNYQPYIYDGGAWVAHKPYVYSGSAWVEYG